MLLLYDIARHQWVSLARLWWRGEGEGGGAVPPHHPPPTTPPPPSQYHFKPSRATPGAGCRRSQHSSQLLITAHCAFLFQNNICKHWLGHIASHVTQDRTVVSFITGFTQLVNSSFSIPHTAPLYFETRFAYNDLALFHV